jgi:hypothetical protein
MSTLTAVQPAPIPRLLRTGVLTALVDGLWACVLTLIYGSTIPRLWQGVASVLLGPSALEGGTRTALIGVLMHIGVAFTWSAVFLLLHDRWPRLRTLTASRGGVLKVAAVYGPLVWAVMSLAVIPLMTQRAPKVGLRWVIQAIGHIFFVGTPIVASVRARS